MVQVESPASRTFFVPSGQVGMASSGTCAFALENLSNEDIEYCADDWVGPSCHYIHASTLTNAMRPLTRASTATTLSFSALIQAHWHRLEAVN